MPIPKNITKRFFKFIEDSPVVDDVIKKFNVLLKKQLDILKAKGVNTSGIIELHLDKAFSKRKDLLVANSPDKYVLHIPSHLFNSASELISNDKKGTIGYIDLLTGPNGQSHIGMVKNTSNGRVKGMLEFLTNAAIKTNRQLKGKGVVSGEELWLPEKTSKMYSKYKNKLTIGNYGIWGKSLNNPVYLLTKETYDVPTKSILFDPSIIDDSGKMHVDWNNSDILKVFIPLLTTLNVSQRISKSKSD